MAIKLIVGLQNPGTTYQQTRHNAGAWCLEAIAEQFHGLFKPDKKLHGELASGRGALEGCKFLLPNTFMNHSGQSVQATAHFFRIKVEEILIIHDELDLPPGRLKLKTGGGHGGHNGLRDTITCLGSSDFHRLRIGIGHPGHKELVLNYVLGRPDGTDKALIIQAIERSLSSIPLLIEGHFALAMNQLNS